jgi:transposase
MASRQDWAKRVERWGKSGLTARDFGAREGFDGTQLSWWKWQLGKSGGGAKTKKRRAKQDRGAAASEFLPARLVETSAASVGEPLVEIVLGDECVIRVGASADPELIGHVLALALRRAR